MYLLLIINIFALYNYIRHIIIFYFIIVFIHIIYYDIEFLESFSIGNIITDNIVF
jgi:hypothetical protein